MFSRLERTKAGVGAEAYREPMNDMDVIRALWDRIEARDWPGLAALLADDIVVEWPASSERIVGRRNFVAVQSEYPEGWSIKVLRIVPAGADVVSEVEVPHEGLGVFRAVSFWTLSNGLVSRGREHWTTLGGEPRPGWREKLTELDPHVVAG